jgi:GAF domain-containing protein
MAPIKGNSPKTEKHHPGPFRDILEVARLLSSSTVPEKVIEVVVAHLCERLGKRSRCALLEGDDLRLRFWAGEHSCPVGGLLVDKNSIVWDVVNKGIAINLTDPRQTNGYTHSLAEPIKIKCIIPLTYVDPITQQKKKLGALIIDSGQEGVPILEEDFEYLQVIGQLISAIAGRAELIQQLMTSCRRQEAILMQTAHNFRNSIAVIGGFSQRIAHLTIDKELAAKATHLHEEVKTLEAHLAEFETYMNLKT